MAWLTIWTIRHMTCWQNMSLSTSVTGMFTHPWLWWHTSPVFIPLPSTQHMIFELDTKCPYSWMLCMVVSLIRHKPPLSMQRTTEVAFVMAWSTCGSKENQWCNLPYQRSGQLEKKASSAFQSTKAVWRVDGPANCSTHWSAFQFNSAETSSTPSPCSG